MAINNSSQLYYLVRNESKERPFSLEKIAKAIHAEHLLKSYGSKYRDLLIKRIKPKKKYNKKLKQEPIITYKYTPLTQKLYYNNLNENKLPQLGFHSPFPFKRNNQTKNRNITKMITNNDNNELLIENEMMNELNCFTKTISIGSYKINLNQNNSQKINSKVLEKSSSTGLLAEKFKQRVKLMKTASEGVYCSNVSKSPQFLKSNVNQSDNNNNNLIPSLTRNKDLPLLFLTTAPEKKIKSNNNNIIKRNSKIAINCLQLNSTDKLPKEKIVFSNQSRKSLILMKDDQTYNRVQMLDKLVLNVLQKEK